MLGTLSGEKLTQPVNGFRMKPYYGTMPPNPFRKEEQTDSAGPTIPEGPPLDPFRGKTI